MTSTQTTIQPHAERWAWVLDVLFGAIAAIALEKYEPIVRSAWAAGFADFSLSVFVAICVCSFFVYDVAAHHALIKKYPYRLTALGFVRFYLDLVMAFILFMLLSDALRPDPDWGAIVLTITSWHVAAAVWHVLARWEHAILFGATRAIMPHFLFIGVYWLIVGLCSLINTYFLHLDAKAHSVVLLVTLSATILVVSFVRWNQVIRKIAT